MWVVEEDFCVCEKKMSCVGSHFTTHFWSGSWSPLALLPFLKILSTLHASVSLLECFVDSMMDLDCDIFYQVKIFNNNKITFSIPTIPIL